MLLPCYSLINLSVHCIHMATVNYCPNLTELFDLVNKNSLRKDSRTTDIVRYLRSMQKITSSYYRTFVQSQHQNPIKTK
jgi:hypothetical protein